MGVIARELFENLWCSYTEVQKCTVQAYRVAQKSKPLSNDQKNLLYRIKTCE